MPQFDTVTTTGRLQLAGQDVMFACLLLFTPLTLPFTPLTV